MIVGSGSVHDGLLDESAGIGMDTSIEHANGKSSTMSESESERDGSDSRTSDIAGFTTSAGAAGAGMTWVAEVPGVLSFSFV